MSRTDDERLGLGWEVWFLLALLVAGALVSLQVLGLMGAGFEAVERPSSHRGSVGVDLRRLLIGGSVASTLAAAAIRLIRTTDWNLDSSMVPDSGRESQR